MGHHQRTLGLSFVVAVAAAVVSWIAAPGSNRPRKP